MQEINDIVRGINSSRFGNESNRKSCISSNRVFLICDAGPDVDDAKALIECCRRHHEGEIVLCGVIVNGGNPNLVLPDGSTMNVTEKRAILAKTIMTVLGCPNIPVAIGAGTSDNLVPAEHEFDHPYIGEMSFVDAHELLTSVLMDGPCVFQVEAGMQDLWAFVNTAEDFRLVENCELIVYMGGAEKNVNGEFVPDTAANNKFCMEAAEGMFKFVRANEIPMIIIDRNAIPPVDMRIAEKYESTWLGQYVNKAGVAGLRNLLANVMNKLMPERCNLDWFISTFAKQFAEELKDPKKHEEFMKKFNPDENTVNYDVMLPHLENVKPYDYVTLLFTMSIITQECNNFVKIEAICNGTIVLISKPFIKTDKLTARLHGTFASIEQNWNPKYPKLD